MRHCRTLRYLDDHFCTRWDQCVTSIRCTDIQFKEKAAIKGIDKYVKLFVIWLSIDRLLPNCKLSMKTSAKNISINDLLGLKHWENSRFWRKNYVFCTWLSTLYENIMKWYFSDFIVLLTTIGECQRVWQLSFFNESGRNMTAKIGIFVRYHYFTFFL